MKKIVPFISLVLAVLFTLSTYFYLQQHQNESITDQFENIKLFSNSKPIDNFELQSGTGQTINNQAFNNKWTVINFGYTSCPDICPTNLADVSIAQRILHEEFQIKEQFQSWFISLDPARDTNEVVLNYAQAFHLDLLGLRGEVEVINKLTFAFGYSYQIQKEQKDDEVYWIAHSDMMIIVNPKGQYAGYVLPPYNPVQLANAFNSLIEDGNLN